MSTVAPVATILDKIAMAVVDGSFIESTQGRWRIHPLSLRDVCAEAGYTNAQASMVLSALTVLHEQGRIAWAHGHHHLLKAVPGVRDNTRYYLSLAAKNALIEAAEKAATEDAENEAAARATRALMIAHSDEYIRLVELHLRNHLPAEVVW